MKHILFATVLFLSLSARVCAQLPETVTWEPSIKMDKHLYPSYIIAGAAKDFQSQGDNYIGEPKGLLGIAIKSTYRFAKFKLEIRADEIADPTYQEFTLPHDKRGEYFFVFPNINYRYLQLKGIKQPTPLNVTFKLYIDGKEESERIETVRLHSINDCPFYLINPDKTPLNMSWMYAAYVNENHPMIDEILREALNTGLVDMFTDYQMTTETNRAELFKQTIAVWTALYNRKMTYSNVVTPSLDPGKDIYSQNIRFFDETMKSAQANCVDGSVAFSSIFRRIGLAPFLMLVPGHCFMGFYVNPEKTELYCLETTLIGRRNITAAMVDSNTLRYYMNLFPPDIAEKNKNAIISYAYALKVGTANYINDQPNLTAEDQRYLLIDIAKSRKEKGVIPIPN